MNLSIIIKAMLTAAGSASIAASVSGGNIRIGQSFGTAVGISDVKVLEFGTWTGG